MTFPITAKDNAIPGMFSPIEFTDMHLIDGAVIIKVPLTNIKKRREAVVAVNVSRENRDNSECKRILKPFGRIVVVGMSKEEKVNFMVKAIEWTHHHFPNFLDVDRSLCRESSRMRDFR